VGKWRKPNNKLYKLPRKPHMKPPFNKKGNKRLNKKNDQWHLISKR
jgi:hypothetical protein